jgi:acetyl esterase/lipase
LIEKKVRPLTRIEDEMIHKTSAATVLVLLMLSSPVAGQLSYPQPSITQVYREVGGDSLYAYVFLPAEHRSSDQAHAILLFHGGGWSAGMPQWTFPAARRFADSGLVAIAIQYRLSNGDITPSDAIDDACAAFGWARGHAAELGLSGRIAGYGVSAGGHIVAATATIGCPNGAGPDALLLWSPALDLVNDRWFTSKLQGRATAADLSPARHVGPSTPPTSIVHGERDTLTPLAGVRRYCAALIELGRICDLQVYPGVGHLLTRNLANQESDFDLDPEARANGIAQQHRFLRRLGFVKVAQQR